MSGLSLAEFLLARIAEDETNGTTLIGMARKDWTARWMAECEAKRRIIESMTWADRGGKRIPYTLDVEALQFLALPYADHPDYQQEWRALPQT